jgi:tRNA threonylcarbamoyladenosine biosynthesis protein TsaB
MLQLAVDTSTRLGSVAVLRDGTLLGVRATATTTPHAAGLFADLQSLLDELRIPITAFELFAVAAGPGSFTGLRVGLTAVKAWAEAFDRPIAPVSSLEAIAVQSEGLPDVAADAPIVAIQDARRGQVFGCVYQRSPDLRSTSALQRLGEEVLLPADEFLRQAAELVGARQPIFVSPAPEVFQAAIKGSAIGGSAFDHSRIETVSGVLAPFIGKLGHARALRGDVVDAMHLDANYVRRTDAEVKWTDRSA